MPRTSSSASGVDPDVVLGLLVLAGLIVLAAIAAALVLAAVATTGLHTGIWLWPDAPGWLSIAARIATHPADPGHSLPAPWSTGVSDHQLAFYIWFTTVVMLTAGLTVGAARPVWRRISPTAPGHATRTQMRRTLSPAAARATARWTRSDLSDK